MGPRSTTTHAPLCNWVASDNLSPKLVIFLALKGLILSPRVSNDFEFLLHQGLMESLANTKRSLQEARSLVDRGRTLVDSTLNGLEKVNKEIKVGVDISKFLNKKESDNAITVSGACFEDTLENAERSLVKFDVDTNVEGKRRTFTVESALDGNLETNLADGIANQIYPGYYDFNKKLEQVKLLLSNLDGQKSAIAKDIDEVTSGKSETSQLRR